MKDEALDLVLEALEKLQWSLEQADCSTGYCCCGSSVDGHTFGDGHSPVDEGEYCQSNALEYANKAITAIKQARSSPVQGLYKAPDLSTLKHSDNCRYWDDSEFCTCGAAEYHELNYWKTKALAAQRQRVVFPTMLRKMWSGSEVQEWLDENVNDEKNT